MWSLSKQPPTAEVLQGMHETIFYGLALTLTANCLSYYRLRSGALTPGLLIDMQRPNYLLLYVS